jgi:hypothetical protein
MSAEARLKQLGIVLPEVPKPVANYLPYRLAGNILYLSGQGPRENGVHLTGKLGADIGIDEGYRRARIVGLGLLAAMRRRSLTAVPICSSKSSARPAATPAPPSAMSCCPTRSRSRSRALSP